MTAEKQPTNQVSFQLIAGLLDAIDRPLLVSDRGGQILFTNLQAQDALSHRGLGTKPDANLFHDILRANRADILGQLEGGEQEVNLPLEFAEGKRRARIRWLPEPDWLTVYIEPVPS